MDPLNNPVTPNEQPAPPSSDAAAEPVIPPPGAAPITPPVATTPLDAPIAPADQDQGGSTFATLVSSFLGGLFSWVIAPIALVLILHFYVFQAFHVVGSSMVPNLHDADYLIISKVDKTKSMVERKPYIPHRGQVIVFKYPQDPSLVFVKRVVGLPGERVVVQNGQVRVYNGEHPEGFNPDTGFEPAGAYTLIDTDVKVPDGSVFVLGDNRTPNGSSDSRDWGFLQSEYIIGNAVARLIPLDQAKIF